MSVSFACFSPAVKHDPESGFRLEAVAILKAGDVFLQINRLGVEALEPRARGEGVTALAPTKRYIMLLGTIIGAARVGACVVRLNLKIYAPARDGTMRIHCDEEWFPEPPMQQLSHREYNEWSRGRDQLAMILAEKVGVEAATFSEDHATALKHSAMDRVSNAPASTSVN